MKPNVSMSATYDTVIWDEDDEPITGGGFTDPRNPWGGFKVELPYHENRPPEWYADNVKRVDDFDTLTEAAQFVADFPGAVWDLWCDCDEDVDYQTGVSTRVMLHVTGDHGPAVLKLAERLQARTDRKLRRGVVVRH